ncbi:DNA-3-methyladenine glycosylase [Rubeoparvulum massiliense]|uniref:DNA-3-methyladenine glycosylase n=1 Tax=Rubeoparvulum massiliense TaxID=1631346 RepID=UPI000B2DBA6D|nr:DNA-3-methyladenine glycosylase [Rubeoparvulum massiliense]
MTRRLSYDFFNRDARVVAQELLGKELVRKQNKQLLVGRIVETEAYLGPEDKAAHSFGNRRTPRTEVMFGPAGFAYVYFIYGMYYNFNVITNQPGKPEGVLIRALEPLEGIEAMKNNRKITRPNLCNLTNGPGKLCQSLAIDKAFYGYDLVAGESLYLRHGSETEPFIISSGARVNIAYAEEFVGRPWRYFIQGHPCISVKPSKKK